MDVDLQDGEKDGAGQNISSETVYLLNTRTPWEEAPRARHQVAEALSKRHRVYFVSANETGSRGLKLLQINSNLTVVLPSWPIAKRTRYRAPLVNELYQKWLFPKVRELVAGKTVCVINFDHTATQIFKYFGEVVYYCNDYHIRNYPNRLIKKYFESCEKRVAAGSRFCVGTCDYLRQRLSRFNKRSFEIRLGAPASKKAPVFERTDVIRLGLVGYIDETKTSIRTIKRLADIPNVKVFLFGPLTASMSELLAGRDSIEMKGTLTGEELLDALDEVDVGIAPYKGADGNPGRTPNKLWLYLIAGKPCVVRALTGIRDWQFEDKFLYRAVDPEDFVEKVLKAYNEDSADLALRRHEFAKLNSWDSRVEEFLNLRQALQTGQ